MMRVRNRALRFGLGLTALAILQPAAAASDKSDAVIVVAQATSDQARLMEQKLTLLENLIKTSGDGAEYQKAATLMDDARRSMEAGDLEAAKTHLDAGLRIATKARAGRATKAAKSARQAKERDRFNSRRSQITGYRRSVKSSLGGDVPDSLARELEELDRLVADADQEFAKGDAIAAGRVLDEAYKVAVSLVSQVHGGATIVTRLEFDSAADEYDYERRRNDHYRLLIDVVIDEQKPVPETVQMMTTLVQGNLGKRKKAESLAAQGKHSEAIGMMEGATRNLIQALRVAGLPVSE
jgi:hypothetical protein